jgi:hypothetical protein
VPDILQPMHMPGARVYGEEHWHKSLACARDLCHIPERLRRLVRRHNRVSCEAARIQLRVAAHIGPVHNDGHGFVGRDVNLLFRLLDARSLKRMLAQSGAEVAFITSGYVYENVIRRRPSLVDPALFRPVGSGERDPDTRVGVLARRVTHQRRTRKQPGA